MIARDWRDVPTEALVPLYARERHRWLTTLQWDPANAWMEVERARIGWGLPGFVAVDDDGSVGGFVFYLHTGTRFEVGGILAESAGVTRILVDALMDAAAQAAADEIACFMYEGAPALGAELDRRGFVIDPFLYLARAIGEGTPAIDTETRVAASPWRDDDAEGAARLFERAYEPAPAGHFAPARTPDEWVRYVRNLGGFGACGTLHPLATRVLRRGPEVKAVLLATMVAAKTAHVAQLAVDHDVRRRGVATALVADACAAAARSGATTVTLLVNASNAPARALYERLGFVPCATFLAASRRMTATARVA